MFDRCRVWRNKLTRLMEGSLPLNEWALLEEHLNRCSRCRQAQEADRSLREICRLHTGLPSKASARAFDDRVVTALRSPASPAFSLTGWLGAPGAQMRARWSGLSFEFLTQLAGGALLAASVTAVCLLSALHPTESARSAAPPETSLTATVQNGPPVPLETLLQSASPRAALLWRTPSTVRHRALEPLLPAAGPAAGTPAPVDFSSPRTPGKQPSEPRPHSEMLPSSIMG
jgi:anti-sigma factor RsiW